MFNILQTCLSVFCNSCTILHSRQQNTRVPAFPHPHHFLLLFSHKSHPHAALIDCELSAHPHPYPACKLLKGQEPHFLRVVYIFWGAWQHSVPCGVLSTFCLMLLTRPKDNPLKNLPLKCSKTEKKKKSHPHGCKVVFHYGSNLHFPNDFQFVFTNALPHTQRTVGVEITTPLFILVRQVRLSVW